MALLDREKKTEIDRFAAQRGLGLLQEYLRIVPTPVSVGSEQLMQPASLNEIVLMGGLLAPTPQLTYTMWDIQQARTFLNIQAGKEDSIVLQEGYGLQEFIGMSQAILGGLADGTIQFPHLLEEAATPALSQNFPLLAAVVREAESQGASSFKSVIQSPYAPGVDKYGILPSILKRIDHSKPIETYESVQSHTAGGVIELEYINNKAERILQLLQEGGFVHVSARGQYDPVDYSYSNAKFVVGQDWGQHITAVIDALQSSRGIDPEQPTVTIFSEDDNHFIGLLESRGVRTFRTVPGERAGQYYYIPPHANDWLRMDKSGRFYFVDGKGKEVADSSGNLGVLMEILAYEVKPYADRDFLWTISMEVIAGKPGTREVIVNDIISPQFWGNPYYGRVFINNLLRDVVRANGHYPESQVPKAAIDFRTKIIHGLRRLVRPAMN